MAFCGVGSAMGADGLEAGISVVDITPIPGYRMSGYFHERLNTGTLDPLSGQGRGVQARRGASGVGVL